jgi:hypothetical protein
MGSSPTLTPPAPPSHAAAEDAFAQLNPALAAFVDHPDPLARRELLRSAEAIDACGDRVWVEQATENPPTPLNIRHAVVRHRAETARQRATDRAAAAERVFDRLNPEFGVPADSRDPRGHQAVRDREAGLSLGTRVAVAASRENDPAPVLSIPGEDYRAADAARQAAARQRHGPERAGAER